MHPSIKRDILEMKVLIAEGAITNRKQIYDRLIHTITAHPNLGGLTWQQLDSIVANPYGIETQPLVQQAITSLIEWEQE